jgi:hypothetical protein
MVQLLGTGTPSKVQHGAATVLAVLATHPANASSIAAADAIPRLVQLLSPGSADVQVATSGALSNLAMWNKASITAAGAIPALALLLAPGTPPAVQESAAAALRNLSTDAKVAVIIAAAGVIPHLMPLLGPGSPAGVQECAAGTLRNLAAVADIAVTIAAAGAIPRLVPLLEPGSPAGLQRDAAEAIHNLALGNRAAYAEVTTAIVSAGAIPHLVQLLGRTPCSSCDSGEGAQLTAAALLGFLSSQNDEARAAIAAAGVSDGQLIQLMMERMIRVPTDGFLNA